MGNRWACRLHRRYWLKGEGEHLPKAFHDPWSWRLVGIITKCRIQNEKGVLSYTVL